MFLSAVLLGLPVLLAFIEKPLPSQPKVAAWPATRGLIWICVPCSGTCCCRRNYWYSYCCLLLSVSTADSWGHWQSGGGKFHSGAIGRALKPSHCSTVRLTRGLEPHELGTPKITAAPSFWSLKKMVGQMTHH